MNDSITISFPCSWRLNMRGAAAATKRTHRPGWKTIASLAAAIAVAAVLGGAASSVAVASVGYHETHTQAVDAGISLNSVSCVPSSTTCVAADSDGNAFYATNVSATSAATWAFWSGPGVSPSEAVECPSAALCLLAAGEVDGGGGNLYRSSSLGGGFFNSFKPTNGVGALSCASTSFCVSGAEGGGFIRYSTNPSGILWHAVAIGTGAMKDVSCPAASFCAAVDDSGNVHVATSEAGVMEAAGWAATNVNEEAALVGIACSSTTSCVAIDGSDEVLNLSVGSSGEASATKRLVDGAGALTAVDCVSATCVVGDEQGGIFASTNAGADWTMRFGGGAGVTSLSCASASLCAAVTTVGDTTSFNPATTTPPLLTTTSSLPAGAVGTPYEAQAQASGGEPPYEWSASGLPPGLSIDPATGEITGTPEGLLCVGEPCSYTAQITVIDSNHTEASRSLTIALAVNAYALKVNTAGTGSGEVNSTPVGITGCGPATGSCEAVYGDGDLVTLTATPAPDSTFLGWSGEGCSATATCQVALNANAEVTASFEKVATTPPWPGPPPPSRSAPAKSARLRIGPVRLVRSICEHRRGSRRPRSLGCARLGLAIRGTIDKAASGVVILKAKARLRGRRTTVTRRARIFHGRWHARLALPRIYSSPMAAIQLVARFKGSPGVRHGHAKRQVADKGASAWRARSPVMAPFAAGG